MREMYMDNDIGDDATATSLQEEINLVLDVALLCTKSIQSDRPTMEDALKLLSGLKSFRK